MDNNDAGIMADLDGIDIGSILGIGPGTNPDDFDRNLRNFLSNLTRRDSDGNGNSCSDST